VLLSIQKEEDVMIATIIVAVVWVVLFLPVAILPLLPQVDTAYAPAPRQLVRRTVKPQHEQAA
jgi:MFS-type transporter involved in bile tolerance (Atg22 family)